MTAISSHPLFPLWLQMKQRCYNANHLAYHSYGGRGITVCERWLNSFANFLADMGDRPPGTTLDREDNNGDYSPDNCRWSDSREQAYNRSTTYDPSCIRPRGGKWRVRITLNGKRHHRTFSTLEEAEDYVADCRFEREMHYRLGL